MSEQARIQKLAKALQTDAMKEQITEWKNQREFLRISIQELWEDGAHFRQWWRSAPQEVREALVLTALEDLPSSSPLSPVLLGITCPDLLSDEIFQADRFLSIVENLLSSKENEGELLSLESIQQNLNLDSTEKKDNMLQHLPHTAKQSLNLARSCLLLQFSLAILLVYSNEKDTLFQDETMESDQKKDSNE
jgi:hypothetical protein